MTCLANRRWPGGSLALVFRLLGFDDLFGGIDGADNPEEMMGDVTLLFGGLGAL